MVLGQENKWAHHSPFAEDKKSKREGFDLFLQLLLATANVIKRWAAAMACPGYNPNTVMEFQITEEPNLSTCS